MGLWKPIRLEWREFVKHVKIKLGDGKSFYFCHDLWCENFAVKDVFPSLFRTARIQDDVVAELLSFVDDGVH